MPDEHRCSEQKVIGELRAEVSNLKEIESRRDERDERIARALESVAEQSGIITSLTETMRDLKKSVDRLFELDRERERRRVEDAEAATESEAAEKLAAERNKTFAIRFWESKYGIYGLAAIAVGFGIDVVFHRSVFTELKELFMFFG